MKLKKKNYTSKTLLNSITVVELIKESLNALLYFQVVRILDSVLIVSIVRTRVVPLSDHVLPSAVTRGVATPSTTAFNPIFHQRKTSQYVHTNYSFFQYRQIH